MAGECSERACTTREGSWCKKAFGGHMRGLTYSTSCTECKNCAQGIQMVIIAVQAEQSRQGEHRTTHYIQPEVGQNRMLHNTRHRKCAFHTTLVFNKVRQDSTGLITVQYQLCCHTWTEWGLSAPHFLQRCGRSHIALQWGWLQL